MSNHSQEEIEALNEVDAELLAWEDSLKNVPKDSIQMDSSLSVKSLSDKELFELLMTPCRKKKDLRNWIKVFLHQDIPDFTPNTDSTSNPLDMIYKLYRTAVYYNELDPSERYLNSVFYCSRGSFKTLAACIAAIMIMMHSGRNVVYIGLIESQAKNAYQMYLRPFLDKPYIADWVKVSSIFERSEIKDRNGKPTTIQVIPMTMNKTSSPRANLVILDEIDKAKGEQVIAFENTYGMLTDTNDKEMAMMLAISSRDSAFGKVQDIIDTAASTNTKVEHWNRITITEKCPNSRSGTIPTPFYVKKDTLISITEDDYEKVPEISKKEYEMQWGLNKCVGHECKLFASCIGFLKNQTSKSKWLKAIDSTQKDILSAPSEEMALSQLLCKLPPRRGLVYSDFETIKNIKTPDQMYTIAFNKPSPHEKLKLDDLINIMKASGFSLYIGADAGFWHPACLLVAIHPINQDVFVLKEHMPEEVDSEELAQWLKDNWLKYDVDRVFVDPESVDLTRAIKKAGFPISTRVDKHIQPGIATVKGFIRRPATLNTQLYVNKDCMGFRFEIGRYSYKIEPDGSFSDKPIKKHDHCFTEGHQILTTDGWKDFKNITYEDKVASITKEKEIVFEHPLDIIKQNYDGEVHHYNGSSAEFIVTPNHNLVHISQYDLKKSKNKNFSLIKSKDFKSSEIYIPLSSESKIRGSYKQPFPELMLTDYEFGWLLGMFLSEGCADINYEHYRVNWYQKKQAHLENLEKIFNKIKNTIPITAQMHKTGVKAFGIQQKKYFKYFSQFGKCDKKFIPRDILLDASIELLDGVFNGLMDGDGSILGNNNDLTTTSKELADDFLELCVLLGYSGRVKGPYYPKKINHKPYYKVRVRRRKDYNTAHITIKDNLNKKHYNGNVYCVTVTTGMIMCRYNGKNFISGNSLDTLRYVLHTLFGKERGNADYNEGKPKSIEEIEYEEAIKLANKDILSPHNIAAKNGESVVDNRHILNKDGEIKLTKKSTVGFNIDEY